MSLQTKNLELKPLEFEDLKKLYKKEKDNVIKEIFKEVLDNIEENPRLKTFCILWQVYLETADLDEKFVGLVGFKRGLDKYGTLEIAYRIFEEYQNNGYATEAVGAVTTYAFNDVRVHSIFGVVKGENVAAARVMAKNKYKYREETEDGNVFEKFR